MCVHIELMYVHTHAHTNSPALTQESPFVTEISSGKCLRHFNKLIKQDPSWFTSVPSLFIPGAWAICWFAFLRVSLNPQCSEGSLYLPLLQHGLVGAGVPPVGQKMMVVTKCLKVQMEGEVELPGPLWGWGIQNGHQLPRAARLFPKLFLLPHCPIERWVLAIPLAIMWFQNTLLPEAWPLEKSQGHARASLGSHAQHWISHNHSLAFFAHVNKIHVATVYYLWI